MYTESPIMLHPFACTSANKEVFKRNDKSIMKWVFGYLKVLACLARAMGYLVGTFISSTSFIVIIFFLLDGDKYAILLS